MLMPENGERKGTGRARQETLAKARNPLSLPLHQKAMGEEETSELPALRLGKVSWVVKFCSQTKERAISQAQESFGTLVLRILDALLAPKQKQKQKKLQVGGFCVEKRIGSLVWLASWAQLWWAREDNWK